MHRSVALVAAPPVTNEEMRSFMSRIAQLAPWQQPRRSTKAMRGVLTRLGEAVESFQKAAASIVHRQVEKSGQLSATSTRVNVIFRRDQFLVPKIQDLALKDIENLDTNLARVETAVEFLDDSIYNVRLSLWMFDAGFVPEPETLHPVKPLSTD